MAMQDLKKKSPASEAKPLSAEAFIAEAERYANGYNNVVRLPIKPSSSKTVQGQRRFLPASFTLSPLTIAALNQLKHRTGLSKSRLLRQLTAYMSQLDSEALQRFLQAQEHIS